MKRLEGKRVYISGPITGEEGAALSFARAFQTCVEARALWTMNPMAAGEQAGRAGYSYADHMRADLHALTQSVIGPETKAVKPCFDVLLQLPGWNASEGAVLERRVADACGIQRIEYAELEGVNHPWNTL